MSPWQLELADIVSAARVATDRLRTLSYGTDASFYRLVPQIVVIVESEAELIGVMAICTRTAAPVTFRAAGTSLSGQAVTDSVLSCSEPAGRDRLSPTTAG